MVTAKSAEPARQAVVASRSRAPSPVQDHPLYRLHETVGNQTVQRCFESGLLQAKLGLSRPGDRFEQEADRVADQVMRLPNPMVQTKPG